MNKLIKYFQESLEELKKVTWPTKKQTLNYAIAVIAISIGIAVYIGAVDFGLNKAVQYIFEKKAPETSNEVSPTTSEPIQVNPSGIQVEGGDVKVETIPTENK